MSIQSICSEQLPERDLQGLRQGGHPGMGPEPLRHNAATFLRKEFGIEAARVILGHTSAAVTEIYAEMDRQRAAEIMSIVG